MNVVRHYDEFMQQVFLLIAVLLKRIKKQIGHVFGLQRGRFALAPAVMK